MTSLLMPTCSSPSQSIPKKMDLQFYVERVDPKDYPKIERIAGEWREIAQKKIAMVSCGSENYARLMASNCIGSNIGLECNMLQKNPFWGAELRKEIYVCKSLSDLVCGIAIVSKRTPVLHVDLVMTHPEQV